jgi:hypothetical protein
LGNWEVFQGKETTSVLASKADLGLIDGNLQALHFTC